MIFAELHGKLGENYSRADERAEDLLTSTAFGLLRYLPPADGLLAVLRRARWLRLDGDGCIRVGTGTLGVDGVAAVRLDFWPRWADHGEPDVLLRLLDAMDTVRAVVLVEAKLHSPKSGCAAEDEEPADEDQPDPDQLARYWQGLQRLPEVAAGTPASLIYLTKHATPPLTELAESLRRIPLMRLGWLSWRDVWAVAEAESARYLAAEDLARLLAHKGLKDFTGFGGKPWMVPRSGRFWTRPVWFTTRAAWRMPVACHFWRDEA